MGVVGFRVLGFLVFGFRVAAAGRYSRPIDEVSESSRVRKTLCTAQKPPRSDGILNPKAIDPKPEALNPDIIPTKTLNPKLLNPKP